MWWCADAESRSDRRWSEWYFGTWHGRPATTDQQKLVHQLVFTSCSWYCCLGPVVWVTGRTSSSSSFKKSVITYPQGFYSGTQVEKKTTKGELANNAGLCGKGHEMRTECWVVIIVDNQSDIQQLFRRTSFQAALHSYWYLQSREFSCWPKQTCGSRGSELICLKWSHERE